MSNSHLADVIEQIATLMLRDPARKADHSANVLMNASKVVRNAGFIITSGDQAQTLPGVGKSTAKIIDDVLKTGESSRLKMLKETVQISPLEEQLVHATGFGPVSIAKAIAKGYTTVEQLQYDDELNDVQRKGLKWLQHTSVRIPRSDANTIYQIVTWCWRDIPGLTIEMMGSYRRGEDTLGDIDIAVCSPHSSVTVHQLIALLGTYIAETFGISDKLFQGIFYQPGGYGRHVDIKLATPEEWPYMLLYFTGSKQFNKVMRGIALSKGYTINEFRMENEIDKTWYIAPNEISIFSFLGLRYVEPRDRTREFIAF
jgi:DNA polymerase/3'-5' exonuclease PolX